MDMVEDNRTAGLQARQKEAFCYGDLTDSAYPECVPELVHGHDGIELFFEGNELYKAILATVDRAAHSVWLKTFIFADDRKTETG